MSSNSALERTINKVLSQKETELISQIDSAFQESLKNLEASRGKLDAERARIIESAKKQAENLKRQIVGSSRLSARNKELVMIETDVNEAFERAKAWLASSSKDESYRALLAKVVEEAIPSVGSDDVIVECNKNDTEQVKKIVADLSKKNPKLKARVSDQPINAIGGVRVKSADGTMSFDNTLDSRIERLKPLIRKNIARMLRGEAGEE
ncbi:archaeal/vacuolar-type H+-ATPase subunit E [Candidatus Nitrososphaera evergladensis SR1]|jgi:V/A-type H+-transporting ATPase subunit E|uniref:A-type ATP synthase subunit E n=1 Tax=Candidatus Nitrososphaera evergladensis SR1 TaxID=1459636 RepID=A0A075N1G2_9ARCH|nr:V-type ATP synthase subunit E family protein [Candidatus Nitrososphaera evergladensis]AIF85309.1 archaeal/vacuolar-type H+-ATPase subunit E [Candidatus Nitrososphaera evergladensis SR1]